MVGQQLPPGPHGQAPFVPLATIPENLMQPNPQQAVPPHLQVQQPQYGQAYALSPYTSGLLPPASAALPFQAGVMPLQVQGPVPSSSVLTLPPPATGVNSTALVAHSSAAAQYPSSTAAEDGTL